MAQPPPVGQVEQLSGLNVPVSVRLCEDSFSLASLVKLRAGTVLHFPKQHDQPLDLYINESRVGSGHAVDLGERLGVVVEQIDRLEGPGSSNAGVSHDRAAIDEAEATEQR